MASLIGRDTSGVFAAGPDEVEVPELRTRSFRTFGLPPAPDGRKRWRIGGGVGPVHYRSDGDPFGTAPWEEIGLALQPNARAGQHRWEMTRAGYELRIRPDYAAEYRRAGLSLRMAPVALLWESGGNQQVISEPIPGLREEVPTEGHGLLWPGAFGAGTAWGYQWEPDRFRKVVRLDREALRECPFGDDGLRLTVAVEMHWPGAPAATVRNPKAGPAWRADGREAFWLAEPVAWDSSEERRTWPLEWRYEVERGRLVGYYSLPAEALREATWPMFLDADIPEEQVGASSDDARNSHATYPGNSNYDETSTLNIWGAHPSNGYYCCGMRFQTVPIPQGATIDSSVLSVCASSTQSEDCQATIYADDVDDSDTFNSSTNRPAQHVYARRTTASVAWNTGAVSWTGLSWYDGPDMKALTQELVDRVLYVSGNDQTYLLVNTAMSLPGVSMRRFACSWDYPGNVSGPKLNVSYTEAAAGVYPVMGGEHVIQAVSPTL